MLHPPQAACEFLASSTEPDAPIPWEAWGPQNTRWFAEPINTDWQHSLYGYRTVEALPPREPETDANPVPKCNLRIRDFNPYGLARMQEVDGYGGGGSGSECWRGRVVREPSTISGQEAFAYDVVSHLPYCEIVSKEAFEITDVMMDDCRILLLKVRGDSISASFISEGMAHSSIASTRRPLSQYRCPDFLDSI